MSFAFEGKLLCAAGPLFSVDEINDAIAGKYFITVLVKLQQRVYVCKREAKGEEHIRKRRGEG